MSSSDAPRVSPADLQRIRDAVERYFSEEYLFDPSNAYFCSLVSPKDEDREDAHGGGGTGAVVDAGSRKPPGLACSSILRFQEVKMALEAVPRGGIAQSDGSAGEYEQRLLVDAMRDSTLVEVYEDNSVAEECGGAEIVSPARRQWRIRRRCFLDERRDPARRTVVVRPLPAAAPFAEVQAFFSTFGSVVSVRRCGAGGEFIASTAPAGAQAGAGDGSNRGVALAIEFASEEEATACATATITFGKAESALAERFFPPRVLATPMLPYRRAQQERQRHQEASQLQSNIARAQATLEAMAEGVTHGGDITKESHAKGVDESLVRTFLTKGRTLKAVGVPPDATWETIKMKLGNLALSNPALKKQIILVKIVEEPGEDQHSHRRSAYIVLRTPAAAKDTLVSFNVSDGDYMHELRRLCPELRLLTPEEEVFAASNHADWVSRKVTKKIQENRKRSR